MDEQKARDILSGRRGGVGGSCLRGLLWAMARPYGWAMRARRWAYRNGVLPSRAAAAPVICVGNLTTGGTGKTPMVAWVVQRLIEAGHKPAILTRGFKADRQRARPGDEGGWSDEARLLEELTGVAVVVGADRVAGAARAVGGGADVLVMDDGFQHRRLQRDLDIVLVDAVEPFGLGHCLPRGLLREPPEALRDADAVVLTHADEVSPERLSAVRERLADLAPRASFHSTVHRPTGLIDAAGAVHPPEDLAGRKVYGFCGLGSPDHFFGSIAALGGGLVGRRALDDHVAYTPALLAELAAEAERVGAEALLTTRKDHVKLAGMELPGEVWQLAVALEVVGGAEQLAEQIAAVAAGPPGG